MATNHKIRSAAGFLLAALIALSMAGCSNTSGGQSGASNTPAVSATPSPAPKDNYADTITVVWYVSQFLSVMPRTTAREHVMRALSERGESEAAAARETAEMLSYFKLPEALWDLYPNTFSGGERLRLNLAHAMVKHPRLLLLDEPTASLDNKTKALVKEMLQRLKAKGTSMIGIFHDLEFMEGVCDQVFNMSEGAIA